MGSFFGGVDAVEKGQIKLIEDLLLKHSGQIYADLWAVGINMALRISDLLSIRYSDIQNDQITLVEGKTKKRRSIRINAGAKAIIERRQKENPSHLFLFQSDHHHSQGRPINRSTVAAQFKIVGEIVGIRLSTHSMRKTRGRAMHNAGVPIERISAMLNHSSPKETMTYLGISNQEIQDDYSDFVL